MTDQQQTEKPSIQGYESHCNCDHCGRPLKIGIQLSGYGVIGADCLNAAIVPNRNIWRAGKPTADWLRTLAKLKQRDSAEQLKRMGYHPSHFVIEIFTHKLAA